MADPTPTTVNESKVRVGLKRAFWAKRNEDGTAGEIHEIQWPEQCNVSNGSSSTSSIYAGDAPRYTQGAGTTKQMDVQVTKFPRLFLKECLGFIEESATTGGISEGAGKAEPFFFGYETTGDQGSIRTWYHSCTATPPVHNAGTNSESMNEDSETSTFTASRVMCAADGVERMNTTFEPGDAGYETAFDKVPFAQKAA